MASFIILFPNLFFETVFETFFWNFFFFSKNLRKCFSSKFLKEVFSKNKTFKTKTFSVFFCDPLLKKLFQTFFSSNKKTFFFFDHLSVKYFSVEGQFEFRALLLCALWLFSVCLSVKLRVESQLEFWVHCCLCFVKLWSVRRRRNATISSGRCVLYPRVYCDELIPRWFEIWSDAQARWPRGTKRQT